MLLPDSDAEESADGTGQCMLQRIGLWNFCGAWLSDVWEGYADKGAGVSSDQQRDVFDFYVGINTFLMYAV